MPGPLAGIRVLDLTRVLAGPLAGQTLGDFGADVIKVESANGDDARAYGTSFVRDADGARTAESGFYLSANRNKCSIRCDFSRAEGKARILDLAGRCDVLLENFRPGTLARYGLGYDDVSQANPRVIYASLTGYGQDGPYADRPGYDAIFQAQSGWMSITGPAEGPWSKTGPSLVDVFTGHQLVAAVLAALYHRDAKGGSGQHIDLALLDCAVAALSHVGSSYLLSKEPPQRLGTAGNGGAPSDVFACADGHIFISSGRQAHFERLCLALGCPALAADPRFADAQLRFTHREALKAALQEILRHRGRDEIVALLSAEGVPVGSLNDLPALFADPHVRQRGMVVTMPHALAGEVELLANPIRFSATPVEYRLPPPLLGEHGGEEEGADWLA